MKNKVVHLHDATIWNRAVKVYVLHKNPISSKPSLERKKERQTARKRKRERERDRERERERRKTKEVGYRVKEVTRHPYSFINFKNIF